MSISVQYGGILFRNVSVVFTLHCQYIVWQKKCWYKPICCQICTSHTIFHLLIHYECHSLKRCFHQGMWTGSVCEKKFCKSPINTWNRVRFVFWSKVATVVLYFLSLTSRPKLTLWVTSGSIAIIFYMGQADNYWALCCPSTISSLMAFKVTFIIKTRYWNPVLGEVSHIPGVICHFLHQTRLKWWRSLCVA